ncbi:MAG: hypothetical protein IJH07_03495 [Ruminococcus sp.]|nr:hypothetical protein [Ruminococcus sp.]
MAENRDNRKRLSSDEKKGGLDALSPKKIKVPDKVNVPETPDQSADTGASGEASTKPARPSVSDEEIDQIISETQQLRQEMAKEVFGDDVMNNAERPKNTWQSKSSTGKKDDSDDRKHTRKEYDERKDEHTEKKSPKKLIIFLLVFLIVGAAAFALIHFVVMPALAKPEPEPTEAPPAPTAAAVTPATADEAEPTVVPTETEFEYAADAAIKSMSRREKICQLFMVTPEVLTDVDLVTEAGNTTKNSLENFPVGGILFSPRNFSGDEQAKKLIADTQSYSAIPLFVAEDDDGTVTRQENVGAGSEGDPQGNPQGGPQSGPGGGPESGPQGGPGGGPEGGPQGGPNQQSQDVELTPESAYDNALSVSQAKREVGFNLDLSLVADVSEAIEGGEDALTVDDICELIKSAVKGYSEGGVIPSVKYFPGQQTNEESDDESIPHLTRSLSSIEENDLLPFRSGISEGVKAIMVDHVIVDELDGDKPATLSSKVVPQLLREKLGFSGVAISDNMSAEIITDKYSRSEIVKGIFAADIDVILNPDSISKYITAIEDALDNGDITEEQLDLKVRRILALKYESGVVPEADE